ncbi:hypothetical protein GWI33_000576 [Rhynchophorus ferrugineus]|uniref:Activin types I and II receptor domain-containing protein n=1 Tax=Rhynchophorus ferrugineus TaxID=354439 RepID=A0A834IZL3_RHYFE|nr:hypothetical protein GWI33_000576 [Rhynchophorus ferrugineus]
MLHINSSIVWFFLSIICLHVIGVWSLLCKCDLCKDDNYTCSTDGYCFTSVQRKKNSDKLIYNYRCLDRKNFLPPEHHRGCESKEAHCCWAADYCNAQIIIDQFQDQESLAQSQGNGRRVCPPTTAPHSKVFFFNESNLSRFFENINQLNTNIRSRYFGCSEGADVFRTSQRWRQ